MTIKLKLIPRSALKARVLPRLVTVITGSGSISATYTSGTYIISADAGLDSIAALTATGVIVQTVANTFAARTITGTSAEIDVANGSGVSGNPTLTLPSALTFTGKTVTGGTFGTATINNSTLNTATVNYSTLNTATIYNSVLGTATVNNSTIGTATINNSTLSTATINNSTLSTATINFSTVGTSTINNSTLNTATVNNSTLNTATLNSPTLSTATLNYPTLNTATLNTPTLNTATLVRPTLQSATFTGMLTAALITASSNISSGGTITGVSLQAGAAGQIYFNSRGSIQSSADGRLMFGSNTPSASVDFIMSFQGATSASPAFKAPGGSTTIQARLADDSAFSAFQCDTLTFGTATITGLTNKASPDSSNDYAIIYDAAGTAVKKATVGSISAAGGVSSINGQTGALVNYYAPQGRLTSRSGFPVQTATFTASTSVCYEPYVGNLVPIYDGTNMVPTVVPAISASVTDNTKSPAAIGASKVNDWFVWNDSGTVRVGHGPDWTSDTARSTGTALALVNGIYLNSATITNGPAASRGTYVGTTRSNTSSTIDWIYGASGSPPTAAFFGVWNMYNRALVGGFFGDTAATWTYTTASFREANGRTATEVRYVIGIPDDVVDVTYCAAYNATGNTAVTGVGLDSTSAATGAAGSTSGVSANVSAWARYCGIPGIGYHYNAALENAAGSASITGIGSVANIVTGLAYKLRM